MTYIFDTLADYYLWTLAFHIMSVISWMAGIFYLPRLFVYHAEKGAGNADLSAVYKEMEDKLFRVIMRPAMMSTWIFGLLLVLTPGIVDWSEIWPWIKMAAVIAMTGFHVKLGAWLVEFREDQNTRSGKYYRFANEAPTILMIVIVIMVVVKPF